MLAVSIFEECVTIAAIYFVYVRIVPMKKALLLSALSFAFVAPVMAADGHGGSANWGYTGAIGAHKWGELSAEYEACRKGVQQSPINISKYMQEAMPALAMTYQPTPLEVVNNGHSVQVNYGPGSGFQINGKTYQLLHFHFHTPSEHYIDGAPYPMELHLVHKAEDGTLGVVGVLMKVGAHNPVIEGIWQNVPKAGSTKRVDSVAINATELLPSSKSYYAYDGSLTTPPCTEGVKWHVLKEPIELSAAQLTAFQSVFPVNARPIQALGERIVKGD